MKQILVSVIIPVFNSEKYLGECLDSVLGQTMKNIEIICVDDGSTDTSLQVLEKYARQDGRVKVLKQKNKGPGPARNRAMKAASGEFLAFMDSDDFYPENTVLEKLYAAAKQYKVKIAGGSFSEVDAKTGAVRTVYDDNPHLFDYQFKEAGLVDYRDWQQDIGWIRFIYDRKIIIDNRIFFPNLRRYEDPVFFVQAMLAAGKFYAIPDVVYRYRLFHKPTSLSQNDFIDAIYGIAKNLKIAQDNSLETLKKWTFESLWWSISLSGYTSRIERERDEARQVNRQLAVENRDLRVENTALKRSRALRVGRVVVWPVHQIKRVIKRVVQKS